MSLSRSKSCTRKVVNCFNSMLRLSLNYYTSAHLYSFFCGVKTNKKYLLFIKVYLF